MARQCLMTWEKRKNRWRKIHTKSKATPYLVTPEELGFPNGGKTETWQAANDWWKKKLLELEKTTKDNHPHAVHLAELREKEAIARKLGFSEEADNYSEAIGNVEQLQAGVTLVLPETATAVRGLRALGWQEPKAGDWAELDKLFAEPLWADRKARLNAVPQNQTALHHVKLFLAHHEREVKKHKLTTARYGVLKNSTNVFLKWFGEATSISSINEATVKGFYDYLSQLESEGAATSYMKTHFQVAKQWIATVAEDNPELVRMPNNIRSKRFAFGKTRTEPNPFTKEEVALLQQHASAKMQTAFLLMLNCAFTQQDVAVLQGEEIDWKKGRLIAVRSKLKKIKEKKGSSDPIKTNWILWDKTLELLKANGNRTGTVLLTDKGTPLVSGFRNDGELGNLSAFKTAWQRLIKKLKHRELLPAKWHKTPKQFRKTCVNLCQKHKEHYKVLSDLLEHSVAKNHYLISGEVLPHLDAAVIYAGRLLGFQTKRTT